MGEKRVQAPVGDEPILKAWKESNSPYEDEP